MPYVGTDFSERDEGESFVLQLDFSSEFLAPGDTLLSAAWAMTTLTGTDAAPQSHVTGAATVDNPAGPKTQQRISGQLGGNVYMVKATGVTANGDTLILWSHLPVRKPGKLN